MERRIQAVEEQLKRRRENTDRYGQLQNSKTDSANERYERRTAEKMNYLESAKTASNLFATLNDYPQYQTPQRAAELKYALSHGGRRKKDETKEDRNLRILNNLRKKWDREDSFKRNQQ